MGRCLTILYESPLATAELLHVAGQSQVELWSSFFTVCVNQGRILVELQEISSDDSIHSVFSLIYGNCIFPSDEKAVLEVSHKIALRQR